LAKSSSKTTKTNTTKARAKTKAKTSASKPAQRVTRIKASESAAPRVSVDVPQPATESTATPASKPRSQRATNVDGGVTRRSPWRAIADYFTGAWYELRQVRWPNRSQTWQMTGALLGFTAFFVVVILLLDAGANYLFNHLLGR